MGSVEISIIIGIIIAIIGYFLKSTMEKLNRIEDKTNIHETQIEVLKSNYTQMERKIDDLMGLLKDISTEIKSISREMHLKKNRDE